MSISRKFLKGLGIEEAVIDAIIEAHTDVTTRMQAEIDALTPFKADSEKLSAVQKELDKAKQTIADQKNELEPFKQKYEDEHSAFEAYKTEVSNAEKTRNVREAYTNLLKANKIDDKCVDKILKVTDFSGLTLGEDGKFENQKDLEKSIKDEWKSFIVTTETRGTNVETPPESNGSKTITAEEIMSMTDASERQKAIAENMELFQ